jgi:hypothetical protein
LSPLSEGLVRQQGDEQREWQDCFHVRGCLLNLPRGGGNAFAREYSDVIQ